MSQTRISRRAALYGGAALGVSLTLPGKAFADAGTVNFYNWDTYIGETTLADFKAATGINVRYDLFADNQELFAKIRNGNPGYDLIVPTNDFVERMILADMLVPLDHSKIPNKKNIGKAFLDPQHDPGRKYTMPYMWGTIGIGYRKSAFDGVPDSWKWLYDDATHKGAMVMLSEATTVMQLGLKYLGKSMNDWSDENIAQVEALITKQKPNLAGFAEDNGQDLLLSGDVDLAMEWNGDILQVQEEDDDIAYVVPKEGGLIWEDDLCIPKDGPNPDGAHALINFLLDAEVGRDIADFIQYATPNAAAKALMDDAYTTNPAIFPSDETLAQSEVPLFPGQEWIEKIEASWTRILAS